MRAPVHVRKWDGRLDAGDHHGFLIELRRSSAWSFPLRDGRQAYLLHRVSQRRFLTRRAPCPRRFSACGVGGFHDAFQLVVRFPTVDWY